MGVGVCLPRGMPCLMPEGCHSVLAGLPVWVAGRLVRSDWEVCRDGASYAELAECAYI